MKLKEQITKSLEDLLTRRQAEIQATKILKLIDQPPNQSDLLTDEEIKSILLTEDDAQELEQTATIGLSPDEHIEYKQRLQWLCDMRLKELTAKAQLAKADPIIRADERAKTFKEIGEWLVNDWLRVEKDNLDTAETEVNKSRLRYETNLKFYKDADKGELEYMVENLRIQTGRYRLLNALIKSIDQLKQGIMNKSQERNSSKGTSLE